jgi:futalosine hydrolase
MKLLIVSATEAEISPFAQYLEKTKGNGLVKNYDVDLLITGVGMVATTYALTKRLQTHQYELVVQAGVCGCFENRYSFGEVLFIHTDQYGDLGAQDHEKQLDIF